MASIPAHPAACCLRAGSAAGPRRSASGSSNSNSISASCGRAPTLYHPTAAPQRCRCRRCGGTRVLAFRWGGDSDTTTTDTTKQTNNFNVPKPPSTTPSSSSSSSSSSGSVIGSDRYLGHDDSDVYAAGGGRSPVEAAIQEMQREEQVRDVQRAVVEAVESAQGWWRDVPDKRSLLLGGAGLVVVAYLGSAVLSAVDRVPLLPGLFQAVGVGYSAWFWWRFVLFAEGRQELRESLGHMRQRVAESMEGLSENALDTHPNPGTGETGAAETARGVVDRMAARHNEQQQQQQQQQQRLRDQQQQQQPRKDDGSWVDEPSVKGSGLSENYVAGLLEELDGRLSDMSGSGTSSPGAGVRPPSVFALLVAGVEGGSGQLWAPEPGAEEASAVGGGNPPPGAEESSSLSSSSSAAAAEGASGAATPTSSPGGSADPFSGVDVTEVKGIADLDPCLGWDVEACRASGHMKLGEPDTAKLEALEQAALRQANASMNFSRHVDEVLHEPGSVTRGASLESVHLEGEYGRAAGSMEREVMEGLVSEHPEGLAGTSKSVRRPAVGEEAGTGGL